MKITVLVDNRIAGNGTLQTEHGLSLFVEHDRLVILCDMGATGLFADNAKALGIDIASCSLAFVSHGHNDHCGGMERLLDWPDIPVYIHSDIPHEEYVSIRKGTRRSLSCGSALFKKHKERFRFISGTTEIAKGAYAVQCTTHSHPMPYGNIFLLKNDGKKEENDTFVHELSLAFITDKGLVIIAPCSHCGALNIIHDCVKATGCQRVHAYIGGLHFVDGENCTVEAAEFASIVKAEYPDTLFFTGHCTCSTALEILETATSNIKGFSTGDVIEP